MGRERMRKLTPLAAAAFFIFGFAAAERIDPLPPEQAFVFSAENDGRTVYVSFAMLDDFYLYRDRILMTTDTPGFSVSQTRLPPAEIYDDPFFGKTGIYENEITLEADISGAGEFEFKIISQGCDRQLGICYPPQTHVALLQISDADSAADSENLNSESENDSANGEKLNSESENDSANGEKLNSESENDSANGEKLNSDSENNESANGEKLNSESENGADEAADAARIIADKSLWAIMAAFFGFGLLLSFTPCVLPMIPILLGVIGGDKSGRAAIAKTAAYIGGVVISYTALGIAAGLSGQLLAPYLQHPAALAIAAGALFALALSMFGLYDIRIPALQKTGGGAFMAGVLSAAIVSPCVAAPLIGALIYIGNTGDALVGGAALFSLSLGMSALLAVAGIGGANIIPRAGAWTGDIKLILGALLCGAAVWVSSPLLPPVLMLVLYGGLIVFCGAILWSGGLRGLRAAAIVLLLWGGAMIVGAAGGGQDPLSPLSVFHSATQKSRAASFLPVRSASELQKAVSSSSRPAMLEFYADWCVSCKEMEAWTFTDSRVRAQMEKMLLLRADVTANNENDRELLEKFGLYGPPAILFFAPGGELVSGVRVNGYQSANAFLQTLRAAGI